MKWNVIFDPDFKIWFYQQEQELQDEAFTLLVYWENLDQNLVDQELIPLKDLLSKI